MNDAGSSPSPALLAFLDAENPEAAIDVVRDSPDDLLAGAALTALDRLIATEPDALRRHQLAERRELLATVQAMREKMARLPEGEQRYLAFMHLPNSLGVAALVLDESGDVLDSLERTAVAKQMAATGRDATDIASRLADLRQARAAGPAALRARLDAAEAAANRLGPDLVEWMSAPDWPASEAYLRSHESELVTAEGELAMSVLLLANRHVDVIAVHAQLLRHCHDQGIAGAYAELYRELADTDETVADLLDEWTGAPDWDASQAFMQAHADALLTDEGEAAMVALASAEPDATALTTHVTLLRRCRKIGVPAAYDELRALVDDPLDRAIDALLRVDSAEALIRALAEHAVLAELRAVEAVADMARQAQAAGAVPAANQVLYYATVMADGYLRAHVGNLDWQERAAFVALLERMVGIAVAVADSDLAGELRAMAQAAGDILGQHPGDRP